ncbi:restriction endonuclease [Streptomyces gamaensis]|uniref:Restriction endonuclease n=1 Tax=Streptomyces gamaensis TaxID=1763542 RepID=A0ABW0ZCY3_9ACTN
MANRRRRRSAARRRRVAMGRAGLAGGALLLITFVVFWSVLWPYVVAVGGVGGLGAAGWRLWRTDRLLRSRDRSWRREEAVKAGHRTLADVDKMSGTEFEELVAELCRRDGCSEVRRVGGTGDQGADVVGRLPDGRAMVVQCKRYAPRSSIASREMRDLLGSKVHFGADAAVFVTTTRLSGPSEEFARTNGIIAIHRDLLGLWNSGTPLAALAGLNGAGQGDRGHRRRWRKTYGANGR